MKGCSVLFTMTPILSIYPNIFRSKLELGGVWKKLTILEYKSSGEDLDLEDYPHDSHYLQSTF